MCCFARNTHFRKLKSEVSEHFEGLLCDVLTCGTFFEVLPCSDSRDLYALVVLGGCKGYLAQERTQLRVSMSVLEVKHPLCFQMSL